MANEKKTVVCPRCNATVEVVDGAAECPECDVDILAAIRKVNAEEMVERVREARKQEAAKKAPKHRGDPFA